MFCCDNTNIKFNNSDEFECINCSYIVDVGENKHMGIINKCCESPNIIIVDHAYTCVECGTVKNTSIYVSSKHDNNYITIYKSFYKSRNHFKYVIKYVCGNIYFDVPMSVMCIIVKTLGGDEVTIHKIINILRSNKLNKYVKMAYQIYYMLTAEKVISLDEFQINCLLKLFDEFTICYRKHYIGNNNISHMFLLRKFCEILKFYDVVEKTPASKLQQTRDKHNKIFNKIINHINI